MPSCFSSFPILSKDATILFFFLCSLTWEIQVQCVQSNILLIWHDYYFIHCIFKCFEGIIFFKKLGVLEMKVFCPRFTLYKTAKILIRILLVCTMYSWIQPLWNVKYAAAGIIPLHTHTHTLDKKLSYGIVFYFLKPTWGWCWYSINRIKSNSRDGGYYF